MKPISNRFGLVHIFLRREESLGNSLKIILASIIFVNFIPTRFSHWTHGSIIKYARNLWEGACLSSKDKTLREKKPIKYLFPNEDPL